VDEVGDQAGTAVAAADDTVSALSSGAVDLQAEIASVSDVLDEKLLSPVSGGANLSLLPVTGLTDQVLAPVTSMTPQALAPVTGLIDQVLAPVTSLTQHTLAPISNPAEQVLPSLPDLAQQAVTPVVTEASTAAATGIGGGDFVCVPAAPTSSSTVCSDEGLGQGLVATAQSALLATSAINGSGTETLQIAALGALTAWVSDSTSTWASLTQAGSPLAAESADGTTPDGLPWDPIDGIVQGLSSVGGSGGPGASGSVIWLFVATLASAVVLRNGGPSQLASGTVTVLSGRAALIEDRPG
jgi:hypothetical protein